MNKKKMSKSELIHSMTAGEFADLVLDQLNYDSDTGVFTWKNPPVSQPSRRGKVAGCLQKESGYVRIGINGVYFKAHRLAWLVTYREWPADELDHINGVCHDNRIANLRSVSRAENMWNQRKATANSRSGILGATYDERRGTWGANIRRHGKTYWLGCFKTSEEAHQAYLKAKRELHSTCTI